MSFDWQWSMPGEAWGQQGSYLGGATPPVDGPDAGTLVSLGCINVEWLPLIVGSLEQLRNPSTWPTLDDAGLALVLSRVDLLRQMLTQLGPCVNPVVSLAFDCTNGLVSTLADGSHVPVTGWQTNFCNCVKGCIPAAPPPALQPGLTPAQRACDVATFLAQNILKATLDKMVTDANAGVTLLNEIAPITALLAPVFPITVLGLTAFTDLYSLYVTVQLAHWQAVADDPIFLASIKCAIYSNIVAVGYVDATSYPLIAASLAGIATPYPDVANGVVHWWDMLGLAGVEALQVEATALASSDCSDCGSFWCWHIDFTAGPGGYSPVVGGIWVSGAGWRGTYVPADGAMSVHISEATWPAVGHITGIDLTWGADGSTGATNPELGRDFAVFNGASLVASGNLTPLTAVAVHTDLLRFSGVNANNVSFVIGQNSSGSGVVVIQSVTFRGTGPNPFGANNCT